jgi:hypothetical protein
MGKDDDRDRGSDGRKEAEGGGQEDAAARRGAKMTPRDMFDPHDASGSNLTFDAHTLPRR